MDSNTHSTGAPAGLAALVAELQGLVDQEGVGGLADGALAERVMALRGLLDRLEGHWLQDLADLDARGAAGAEQGLAAASTAAWLRHRLRMSAGTAAGLVRTARALHRGPLTGTARALAEGVISPAHAQVLAAGTHDLPDHTTAEAEPVLVEAARRLDPPRLRRAVAQLRLVADPDHTDQAEQQQQRRGLWLAATWEGMVAVNGLLDPEAGQSLLAALEPLARPASASDDRSGSQRRADALAELARRTLEAGRLPRTGGVRPQLLVTVDLDSLLGLGGLGGEVGGAGPLAPEPCRRLACDGAVTRVLVARQRTNQHHPDHHPGGEERAVPASQGTPRLATRDPTDEKGAATCHPTNHHPGTDGGLAARLRAAAALLPPVLGGAPAQPLEVGRTTRVVQPAQRTALAVRDGGCVFPGCDRPLAWCEAHHLRHWLHGGPTDLANLALLCRAHHRAVHEGGWRLARDPDGRLTATPPYRRPQRAPAAA
jgi:Domain of unknown function (DUF222)/HNH endonuclease